MYSSTVWSPVTAATLRFNERPRVSVAPPSTLMSTVSGSKRRRLDLLAGHQQLHRGVRSLAEQRVAQQPVEQRVGRLAARYASVCTSERGRPQAK